MYRLLAIAIPLCVLLASGRAVASGRSGEEIYAATCASCHGSDGRGAPAGQTGLAIQPRDLTGCRRTAREPDQDWYAVIAEGGPARGFNRMMPAFGEVLSESEQKTVHDYARGFCQDTTFPRGNLNFPRALVTEKAFIEDEFVVSTAVATRDSHDVDGKLVYEQRFLRRQQFEIVVPFGVLRSDGGSREGGIGDIAAGMKSALLASLDSGSILSLAGEMILPTGNEAKGFGKGAFIFEPFLSFGQGLPGDSFLQVQTGAELPLQEKDGVENEGFLRTALGTSFISGQHGRAFSPMVEIVVFRELKSGVPTSMDLVPQIQVSLSRRQHILASAGAVFPTLNRAGRSPQVMCYLLWDWFDGGLFEAW